MNTFLAMLSVIGGGVILYVTVGLYAARKAKCPGCGKRELVSDLHASHLGNAMDAHGQRYPYSLEAARCGACGIEWRSYNQGEWVTKELFEAGARTPPPKATIRRRP